MLARADAADVGSPFARLAGRRRDLDSAPPLRSITSITYRDEDGTAATFDAANYRVDTATEPGRVVLAPGADWPSVALDSSNPITVRFVAGYADAGDVPGMAKQRSSSRSVDLRQPGGGDRRLYAAGDAGGAACVESAESAVLMAAQADTFDRADSTSLGSGWAEDSGQLGDRLQQRPQQHDRQQLPQAALGWRALDSNNVSVSGTYRSGSASFGIGPAARMASATVSYYALIIFGGDAALPGLHQRRRRDGARHGRSCRFPRRRTMICGIEVDGTTLRSYVNGTLRDIGDAFGADQHSPWASPEVWRQQQQHLQRCATWSAEDLGGGASQDQRERHGGRQRCAGTGGGDVGAWPTRVAGRMRRAAWRRAWHARTRAAAPMCWRRCWRAWV